MKEKTTIWKKFDQKIKMKKYEFLPHTADVKFVALGKSLEGAFRNAAYALTDVMTDHRKVKQKKSYEFSVESEDKMALLYDFLEQFLVLVDSEGFLLSKVNSLKISKDRKSGKLMLKCKISGDKQNHKYEIDTHIKAVTYQQMYVKKSKEGFKLQVILDI